MALARHAIVEPRLVGGAYDPIRHGQVADAQRREQVRVVHSFEF